MAVNETVLFSNENPGSSVIWVAPTYRQSKIAFSIMVREFKKAFVKSTLSPLEVTWRNGSITKFLSTESKDNLRGDSADLIVVDEAAMVEDEVWTNVLRPMLSDTNGKAIIISTPRGFNSWFYQLYQRGQDDRYPDYESFKFPTSSNPYIPSSEIDEVKDTLPSDVFKQEYLAEFLEDGGSVFRNISSCVDGTLEEPKEGHNYVVSWDIAKHSDFSCIVVMDRGSNHVVHFDRFNRIDYTLQIDKVLEIVRRFNRAEVIVDSTGVGDPILEQIVSRGINCEGFLFTNSSKQQLIEHLAVMLEKKEVTFPDITVLINELSSYQYEITRAGNMRYNAPGGSHDDSVIALALAIWKVKHIKNPRVLMI